MLSTCSTEVGKLKDSPSCQKIMMPNGETFKIKEEKKLKAFIDGDSPLSPKKSPLEFMLYDRTEKLTESGDKVNIMYQPTEPNTPKVPFL
jgi:hypothetical protein